VPRQARSLPASSDMSEAYRTYADPHLS
jgi:hypothetical protein